MAFQRREPVRSRLVRLSVAWDELNAVYEKSGLCENFFVKRKMLKEMINRFSQIIGVEPIDKFRRQHPDRIVRGKFIHGYNMNYK